MCHHEYRALAGLLVHLKPFANMEENALYGLWRPLRPHGSPEDPICDRSIPRAMLGKWIDRLTRQAGVPFSYACEETTARIPEDMRVIFHMMTDAAKAGAAVPGLGGFLHGLWWAVALEPRDVVGDLQIPIPVLEFVAIAVGVIVFAPIVGVAAMAIYSDSLTSTDVIAKHAHAELMQFVHSELLQLPEWQTLRRNGVIVSHVYGDGNPWQYQPRLRKWLPRAILATITARCPAAASLANPPPSPGLLRKRPRQSGLASPPPAPVARSRPSGRSWDPASGRN